MFEALLWTHVLFTTAGYAGLIATNLFTLFLARGGDAGAIRSGLDAWRNSSRIFGPLLGVGILLGFWLAAVMHVSLGSGWLVATYVLVVIAMAVQGAMARWQTRTAPVAAVLVALSLLYTALLGLMLLRPSL